MKSSRKALCAFVLVLALTSAAFAGDIQHPVAPPTSVTISGEASTGATDGEIHTGEAASTPAADTVTEVALALLRSLLTLF